MKTTIDQLSKHIEYMKVYIEEFKRINPKLNDKEYCRGWLSALNSVQNFINLNKLTEEEIDKLLTEQCKRDLEQFKKDLNMSQIADKMRC